MDIFKQASKQSLRILTPKGTLSVEQLWGLSLKELDTLAVSLEEEHKQSGKKSFLTTLSVKDKITKLRFDIVLEILNTKADEDEKARTRAERKANNAKIMDLIQKKRDENLGEKSIKELEKLLVDEED